MRTYVIDEKHETKLERIDRLIYHYAQHGFGIDDIAVFLKRQGMGVSRHHIKAIVMRGE